MHRTSEEWKAEFFRIGMIWVHDKKPTRPHALLTSGQHSDGFVNSECLLSDPFLVDQAADDLVESIPSTIVLTNIDRVVGPAMGAIVLAHAMARSINKKRARGRGCFSSYAEKILDEKSEARGFKRAPMNPAELVLIVEDVLTTGRSLAATAASVQAAHAYATSSCAVLVNRSAKSKIAGMDIISLLQIPMNSWEPHRCPLCRNGSEAIPPKDAKNWVRLTE